MGTTNFDVIQANAIIGANVLTQGKIWHVKPGTGSDGNTGRSPSKALATLTKALSLATADQNDVVLLYAQSNSAGSTTARVTTAGAAALDWNKNLVHLIGVNNNGFIGQRSRIAFDADFVTATNLFTLSAAGCLIQNVHFFAGVVDTNPTGCFLMSGERNHIVNCHIAGIGDDANDISGAYSLKLTGHENLFERCVIGLDTIARGTQANSGLLVDGGATRNKFSDCLFTAFLEHATNHVHVRLNDTTAIDRWLWFHNCLFNYESANYAAAGTGVMKIPILTQGRVVVQNCMAYSDAHATAVKWDVDDSNRIFIDMNPTPAADTAGIARAV